jgi:hypothetical protein
MNSAPTDEREQEEELELADEHRVRYWSARFRCTPVELLAVVARVGRSIATVRAEVTRRAGIRHSPEVSS